MTKKKSRRKPKKLISGFTFTHNALQGGYPIIEAIKSVRRNVDEMVVVDCQSDDGTRELLEKMRVVIIDGQWGNEAGKTLAEAHALHQECKGDIIFHFEADEVFDGSLAWSCRQLIDTQGIEDIAVPRLQVEANFQRCRWYPEYVHRVFPKGSVVKEGHTTDRHAQGDKNIHHTELKYGYLWDVTNCFRDQWLGRIESQARLWDEPPRYRKVPIHFMHSTTIDRDEAKREFEADYWTWKRTPFDLPPILRPLVGVTDYRQSRNYTDLFIDQTFVDQQEGVW